MPGGRFAKVAAVVAAVLAAASFLVVRFVRESAPAACRDLGPVERFEVGSIVRVDCARVFVTNVDGELIVLADADPLHRARLIWDPKRGTFADAFGTHYDARGQKVHGPTPGNLYRCVHKAAGGRFVLDVPEASSSIEIRDACIERARTA